MQKHLSLLADVRGCMTRFDPLTPQIVAAQSEDGLTYEETADTSCVHLRKRQSRRCGHDETEGIQGRSFPQAG